MPEIHALKIDQPAAQPGSPQPSIDDVTRRLYDDARPSIVKIETTKDNDAVRGTGFAVKGPGLIATDYHCVAGAKEIKVFLQDGSFHRARIKDIDDINDLAILQIEGTPPSSLKPLELGSAANLKPDTRITALGHPEGWTPLYVSPGYHVAKVKFGDSMFEAQTGAKPRDILENPAISPLDKKDLQAVADREMLFARIHIRHGNSGGPLLDNSGKVIGVSDLTADLAQRKFSHSLFTPVSDLEKLLNRDTPKWQASYSYLGEDWTHWYGDKLRNQTLITATGTAVGLGLGGLSLRSGYVRAGLAPGLGIYGALSLPSDVSNLFSATNMRDQLKFGTATFGDVGMAGGGLLACTAKPVTTLLGRYTVQPSASGALAVALHGAESGMLKTTLSRAGRVGVGLLAVGAAAKLASEFIPNRLVQTDLSRTDGDIRPPTPIWGR